jgi:hypothetical protein
MWGCDAVYEIAAQRSERGDSITELRLARSSRSTAKDVGDWWHLVSRSERSAKPRISGLYLGEEGIHEGVSGELKTTYSAVV